MKLSKVANFVALQTIGHVISGLTDVYIYSRNHGVREKDIYKGLFKDFSFEVALGNAGECVKQSRL